MKVVIITDSFKGSMSSVEAAEAVERGLKKVIPDVEAVKLPVADGGEGTLDIFKYIGIGEKIHCDVTGPLFEKRGAEYILTDEKMAIIEMAQASGITLIEADKRNPMKTTTFGTGELIADAISKGAKEILLAIGGSATNDGGVGLAQALGVSFLDGNGTEITPNCEGIKNLDYIDLNNINKGLKDVKIIVACDVQNTLCGTEGASYIYGPQKGADQTMVKEMDRLLNKLADIISEQFGSEIRSIKGLGAAGGVSVPLVTFADAKLVSGIDTILTYIQFENQIEDADYIITGEGRIDAQTAYGKVISGILDRSKQKNIPIIAFCGILGEGYEAIIDAGIKSCFSIVPGAVSLEDSMGNAERYLEDCVKRVAYLLK